MLFLDAARSASYHTLQRENKMSCRCIKHLLLLFLSIFLLTFFNCSSLKKVKDPNLIIIIVDTLRADHLGCYGYSKISTEHIDRIAEEGLLFSEAVCQVPLTFPSHCSIFTGRHPTAHGVRHNGLFKLKQDEITFAEVLKENGFETGAFIASYVLNSGFGLEQGFDQYYDIRANLKGVSEQKSMQEIRSPERVAEEVNADFFKWIGRMKGKRFFAWVHYYDPHYPYSPPDNTGKKIEGDDPYDREISYADQCIGDLMKKLRDLNVLDRSILLFASDHGEALGEHSELAHGIFVYDCSVRIPLILRAPWIVKGGERFDGLFETVDIMPTLLGLLNIEIPSSVQGRNFAPEIESGKMHQGKAESYAETYMPTFEYGWSELKSIRRNGKKYIEAPIPELYDLEADPAELKNLYDASDEECSEMKQGLAALISKISSEESEPFEIQKIDDESARALKSLGYLSGDYFKSGRMKSGIARADPKLTIEEENIITNGKNLLGKGRFDEAIDAFHRVLQRNPKNYQARIFLIKVLLAKEDYERAFEEAENTVKIAELDDTAFVALGSELWNMYGHILERRNDDAGAINAYRKGFEINPNHEIAFTFPANFYIARKEFDAALYFVQKALEENANNTVANAYFFKLLIEKKRIDEAVEVAKKLIMFDMSQDIQALQLAAKMFQNRKMLAEAEAAYEQIVQIDPNNKEAVAALGNVYFSQKKAQKARETFEHLIALDPGEFRAHYFIGIIDLKKNDEAAARKRFEKVLSMEPTFYQVHTALGSWLKQKGRIEEAREEYKKALALNPEDAVANKALQNLQ